MKKPQKLNPISVTEMSQQLEKNSLAASTIRDQFRMIPANIAETMRKELEKNSLAASTIRDQFRMIPANIAETMRKELEKNSLVSSTIRDQFRMIPANIAETMRKELEKNSLVSSTIRDQFRMIPASITDTIRKELEKNNLDFAGQGEILAQAPSEVSSMLGQFEKIGLNLTEILKQFADTMHTIYPEQTIAGNIRIETPSLIASLDFFQGTEHEQPHNFKTIFYILLFFFLKSFWEGIVIPQINDRYIKPKIDSYLASEVSSSDKEKIYHIRNITERSNALDIEKSRFITGNNVRLRRGPSNKEKIIIELDFGQVVNIISKQRDWVEVACVCDGETLQGFVFKRYIGKFKQVV